MQPSISKVLPTDMSAFTDMGELSGIKPPQMECNDSDLPTAFKSFKQYCQLIFDGPLNTKEDKVKATYILLWIGEEGRNIPGTLVKFSNCKIPTARFQTS